MLNGSEFLRVIPYSSSVPVQFSSVVAALAPHTPLLNFFSRFLTKSHFA